MLQTIYRKDDVKIPITMTNNGIPVDLTGVTLKFILKKELEESSAILIEKTITTHLDATNGKSEIILTTTDTNLTPGKYYYSIIMIDSRGYKTTLIVSDVEISQGLV